MPTTVPIAATQEARLWSAEEFLEWLKPGAHADLIGGDNLGQSIAGFWVRRAWLNPDKLPEVAPCLAEILAGR